jgi:hypothetical protein
LLTLPAEGDEPIADERPAEAQQGKVVAWAADKAA